MTRVETSENVVSAVVAADHPMLAGHFPGHPIVPGAWLLSWVIGEAARRLVIANDARTIAGVKRVKFQRPLAPAEQFTCELSTGSDTARFTVSSVAGVIATGVLELQATL